MAMAYFSSADLSILRCELKRTLTVWSDGGNEPGDLGGT